MKIVAIIPAYNEEKTIASVITVLRAVASIDAVIVVDDGSSDTTAEVATRLGAHVIRQTQRGKGAALAYGALATDADLLFFADADLVGFTARHVESILQPVRAGSAAMCIGLRDRGKMTNWLMKQVFPLIGGERAIQREVFLRVCELGIKDFGIEIAMNTYCKKNHLPIEIIIMKGVRQVIKEHKYGLLRGCIARFFMVMQVVRAELYFRFFFKNNVKQ